MSSFHVCLRRCLGCRPQFIHFFGKLDKETGDYGLGQVNWGHWGKDYGYTPQQLLDPAINIFLTCHVYKFFGKDFGKYHRGSGIQCRAYLVNVKSILSTLDAFEKLKKRNIS